LDGALNAGGSTTCFAQNKPEMKLISLFCLFISTDAVLSAQQAGHVNSHQNITTLRNTTIMENSKADSLSISQVLDNYFKGIYEGDIPLLSSTFNQGTLLFGDVKGQPYAKTLDEYLDGVKNRKSPKDSGQPFKSEIISIEVINSIATARVNVKMYALNYQELLSFHKIGNRWLIVNKMITDVAE
jgi:hypothetical protein